MVMMKEIMAPRAARSTICPVAVLTKKMMREIVPGGISMCRLPLWKHMVDGARGVQYESGDRGAALRVGPPVGQRGEAAFHMQIEYGVRIA